MLDLLSSTIKMRIFVLDFQSPFMWSTQASCSINMKVLSNPASKITWWGHTSMYGRVFNCLLSRFSKLHQERDRHCINHNTLRYQCLIQCRNTLRSYTFELSPHFLVQHTSTNLLYHCSYLWMPLQIISFQSKVSNFHCNTVRLRYEYV